MHNRGTGQMIINRAQFLRLLGGSAAAAMLPVGMGFGLSALAQEGELIVGISSDINTLDPQMSPSDVFRHTIRSTVFEALVFINPDTLKADPMLAESWEVSPDGLTALSGYAHVSLRVGEKFSHPGILAGACRQRQTVPTR